MPKKTLGMTYELYPRPTKGEDGKPLLYVRPAIGFKYTIRAIDEYCHKYRGMPLGEMTRLFTAFFDAATALMRDGSRIETPIGSFAPKLKLSGDFTDPKQVKNEDVSLAGVEYIAAKDFVDVLDERITFGYRRKEQVVKVQPAHELRESGQVEKVLKELMKQKSFTVNELVYESGLRYSTARAYLERLCKGDHPVLRRSRPGIYVRYYPVNNDETAKP